jgi:hypothetical protein
VLQGLKEACATAEDDQPAEVHHCLAAFATATCHIVQSHNSMLPKLMSTATTYVTLLQQEDKAAFSLPDGRDVAIRSATPPLRHTRAQAGTAGTAAHSSSLREVQGTVDEAAEPAPLTLVVGVVQCRGGSGTGCVHAAAVARGRRLPLRR